jgi:energy-converting hydrogenase Eha subunit G
MYDNQKKDWVAAAVTAGLGAGIVTSFAVAQGQNPLIALVITAFAIAATLLIDQLL